MFSLSTGVKMDETLKMLFFFTNPMPKHKIKSLTCQKLQAMREQYFLTELRRKHQIQLKSLKGNQFFFVPVVRFIELFKGGSTYLALKRKTAMHFLDDSYLNKNV